MSTSGGWHQFTKFLGRSFRLQRRFDKSIGHNTIDCLKQYSNGFCETDNNSKTNICKVKRAFTLSKLSLRRKLRAQKMGQNSSCNHDNSGGSVGQPKKLDINIDYSGIYL
jgi:hypothetical protein